jgi:hypothetical protein
LPRCIINLMQADTPRTNHSNPQLVHHSPYRLVPVKSKNKLKTQGADTVFLADHLPDCQKPYLQRYTRILKYSSCCSRNPVSTTFTTIPSFSYPIFAVITMRATKSLWPSYSIKIFLARLLSRKTDESIPALKTI